MRSTFIKCKIKVLINVYKYNDKISYFTIQVSRNILANSSKQIKEPLKILDIADVM